MESEELPYDEADVENLHKIFSLFDKDNSGMIDLADMHELMQSLGKTKSEARAIVSAVDADSDDKITFEEFIQLLAKIENSLGAQPRDPLDTIEGEKSTDSRRTQEATNVKKVFEFLDTLERHRLRCEQEGRYEEAKIARLKYEEIRGQEVSKQLTEMRSAQDQEKISIEEAQKTQFVEFSTAWDNYMADYEATAYASLEKLKEKQMKEYQAFQAVEIQKAAKRVKNSKDLLELRNKQNALARQKQYEEANAVKRKADQLEEFEQQRKEEEVTAIVEKKCQALRRTHKLALQALLKRIQRDRDEQLKHRQLDSERLIQRNKNLRNDLDAKQGTEAKNLLNDIKLNLGVVLPDQKKKKKRNATKKSMGQSFH